MPGATETLLQESQSMQTPHPEERRSLVIWPQHPTPFCPLSTVFPRSHIQGQLSERFRGTHCCLQNRKGQLLILTQNSEHRKIDEQNVGPGRHCHTEATCLQMGNNHQVRGGILPQTQGPVFISVATSVLPASGTPCSVSVTEVIK